MDSTSVGNLWGLCLHPELHKNNLCSFILNIAEFCFETRSPLSGGPPPRAMFQPKSYALTNVIHPVTSSTMECRNSYASVDVSCQKEINYSDDETIDQPSSELCDLEYPREKLKVVESFGYGMFGEVGHLFSCKVTRTGDCDCREIESMLYFIREIHRSKLVKNIGRAHFPDLIFYNTSLQSNLIFYNVSLIPYHSHASPCFLC